MPLYTKKWIFLSKSNLQKPAFHHIWALKKLIHRDPIHLNQVTLIGNDFFGKYSKNT